MSFNHDSSKQAQVVIFSCKLQKSTHPTWSFNNNTVTRSVTQKHFGMLLDTKLDLQGHLKSILNKVNKTTRLLHKLHSTLPRLPLLTIYKSFIRPTSSWLWGYHIRSGIRFISPKIRIYPIQLSSSYNGRYKRDIYRETL